MGIRVSIIDGVVEEGADQKIIKYLKEGRLDTVEIEGRRG